MNTLRPAVTLVGLFTLLTGVVYPLVVTGMAQTLFPEKSTGSLVAQHGVVVGSTLIGQAFDREDLFWGRPSATTPVPYNADASTGTNLGPTNPALLAAVKTRVAKLCSAHPDETCVVPADLVTSSASGLDPHISEAAARFQIRRVAKARGLPTATVASLVQRFTESESLGLLGLPRVNVLKLNLALLELDGKEKEASDRRP